MFQEIWQFLTTDKNWGQPIFASLIAGFILLLLQILTGLPIKLLKRSLSLLVWWQNLRLRVDINAFDVITDPTILLPKLYGEENNPDVLAHHRIPYQRRAPDRDIQAELRTALNETRYLLITARTGIGKTREAATLAQSLMIEGYRAVRVKTGWLDVPKEFPPELGSDRRRILILLDDLNGLFRTGGFMQSPKAEQMTTFGQPSYHDRLRGFLAAFEKMCRENEIRVIATARDEVDEWKVLNFDSRDALWKRFRRVQLPEPHTGAVVALLEESVARASLSAERADFPKIASENDGTLSNVVLNLQRTEKENKTLTLNSYRATLDGSWREVYERACYKHPAVRYVYEAINLLRQIGVELYPWIVKPTASLIWNGNSMQRFIRRRQLNRALRYLVNEEKILSVSSNELAPRDGQIDAKESESDWKEYAGLLQKTILRVAERHPDAMIGSLLRFGVTLYNSGKFEIAALLWKRGAELAAPTLASMFWSNLGLYYSKLERYPEAEQAYRVAIRLNPNYAIAYNNLGLLLDEKLGRFADAEAAYRMAIQLDPSAAIAYYNLGNLLRDAARHADAESAYRNAIELNLNDAAVFNNLGGLLAKDSTRHRDAEAAYRRAIELNPSYAVCYFNLGNLLANDSARYSEAEDSFRKAIELDPNFASAYNNLGLLLDGKMSRHTEAEDVYRKALELDPRNCTALNNLGTLLGKLGRDVEAETVYRKAIELDPRDATAYNNLGALLETLGRHADAEAAYRKSIELDPNYAKCYYNLGTFLEKADRHADAEAAYRKATELDPSYADSYFNLGNLLQTVGRQAEAETAYRKAIELNPDDFAAHNNYGNLLMKLGRQADAEVAYRQAIKLNPMEALNYVGIVALIRLQYREREAIPFLEKLVKLVPQNLNPIVTLASIHKQLGNYTESVEYSTAARALIPTDDWYDLARLEAICGNADAALAHLRRAAQQVDFDRAWAWKDPDLEWIRNDPRFREIVGEPPEESKDSDKHE